VNRQEIKKEAWEKIKGNKWNIWWPMLIICFVEGVISSIVSPEASVNVMNFQTFTISVNESMNPTQAIILLLAGIISGLFMAGYYKYIINFVRTGKFDSKDIIDTVKEKWVDILIAIVLASIIIGLCTCLLVIPGIIMALAYSFVILLVVDTKTKGQDALKASREMMKGYKWNYFVFMLSFIGWVILVVITLGIASIWFVPYVTVAEVMYYDKLKKLKK